MDDLNLSRLQTFDLDGLEDIEACQERWFDEVKSSLKVSSTDQLTAEKFMVPTKATSSRWLDEARDIMDRQRIMMDSMKEMIELMKTESLADKEKVIRIQDKLLQCKEEELKSLRSTVEEIVQNSVQTTVEKEIKSYSAAVKKQKSDVVLTPASLQKVVSKAIEEEDRNKNLMVFGLVEDSGENIMEKMDELFVELGEKPRVSASRIGRVRSTCTRPVKINFSSATTARLVLSKAKKLKQTEKYKAVYICPDISPDERVARKKLVQDLKKMRTEDPIRQHYIKDGKICSQDNI